MVDNGSGAEIYVSPVIVPMSNTISSVNGATNIVEVRSKYLGTTYYVGAGAGRYPTATSIVSDMLEIATGKSTLPFPIKSGLTHKVDYLENFISELIFVTLLVLYELWAVYARKMVYRFLQCYKFLLLINKMSHL